MASKLKSNPHLKPLEQAIGARFGWQTAAWRRERLLEAIEKKAARLGLDELAYCRMAAASPAELEVLAEMVSNSETRFFREPEQFAALESQVIPSLMADRAKERRLEFWSAACATGEEAYSLAILLSEALPPSQKWDASVLATDLRGPAIISASQGRYASPLVGQIERDIRSRYFIKREVNGQNGSYDVSPELKKMITFRRANLYDSLFWKGLSQRFDLIICNNLLLYFHALAIKQTVDRMASVLNTGGLLMVMRNEAIYIEHPRLKPERFQAGAFFRKT